MKCTAGDHIIKICWWHVKPEEKHGFCLFRKAQICLYYHTRSLAHFLGIPWSRLLCTVIGPCGCHAVARPRPCCAVIGVCGIAAWQRRREWQFWPPALPRLPSWRRGGGGWVTQVWWVKAPFVMWGGGGGSAKCLMADHKADSTGSGWWHLFAFHLFYQAASVHHAGHVTRPECDSQS